MEIEVAGVVGEVLEEAEVLHEEEAGSVIVVEEEAHEEGLEDPLIAVGDVVDSRGVGEVVASEDEEAENEDLMDSRRCHAVYKYDTRIDRIDQWGHSMKDHILNGWQGNASLGTTMSCILAFSVSYAMIEGKMPCL